LELSAESLGIALLSKHFNVFDSGEDQRINRAAVALSGVTPGWGRVVAQTAWAFDYQQASHSVFRLIDRCARCGVGGSGTGDEHRHGQRCGAEPTTAEVAGTSVRLPWDCQHAILKWGSVV
jgi:hypothetical protein